LTEPQFGDSAETFRGLEASACQLTFRFPVVAVGVESFRLMRVPAIKNLSGFPDRDALK
jgi:hypothetical protein